MKKKEIIIIVLLIVFGFIYKAVEKGKIKFVDDFSQHNNEMRLVSEQYVEFPQAERIFPLINKISVANPAGEITVDKSADNQVHLLSFFRVYYADKGDVEKIREKARVLAGIENNELNISGDYLSPFPYKRLRIRLQLLVPDGVALDLNNHEGMVSIQRSGKNVFLRQEHGNVFLADIPSAVQVEIVYGNLQVKNIAGNVAIAAQQADILLENVAALRLKGRHGDYELKKIKNNVFIEHAYGEILLDDAQQAEIYGRHSRITARHIRNGITLTDTYENIVLENIVGDINLSSRSSKIEIRRAVAKNMVIDNSFADIMVEGCSGESLNVILKNGNFDFRNNPGIGRLNIEARHAKINLILGALADPLFNLKTIHGRISNDSPMALEIFAEKDESFANRNGQKPEIIVNNIYGDIYLK